VRAAARARASGGGGYAAGGWATAAALERAGFDPNSRPVRPRRVTTLRHALRVALGSRA